MTFLDSISFHFNEKTFVRPLIICYVSIISFGQRGTFGIGQVESLVKWLQGTKCLDIKIFNDNIHKFYMLNGL